MNGSFQTTATVRQRGQFTIPDQIRDITPWLMTNAIVSVTATPNDGIVIKPYQADKNKQTDWKKAWEAIQLARSFKGKYGNLSKFVAEDRKRH